MSRSPRRGFTFAELMFAFGIITILAAILFPVFARAREKANQSSCQMNLHNVGMALRVYAADYYGYLPPADNDLWPLVPRCLPEPRSLVCPSVEAYVVRAPKEFPPPGRKSDPPDKPCDYVYKGGYTDDEKPATAVAGDDDDSRHNEGALYLFLDGHVKWQKAESSTTRDMQEIPGLRDLRKLGTVHKEPETIPEGGEE